MNEALQTTLKKLRLSGMAQSLDVRLQEAGGNGLNHAEFLELTLQDELAVRAERLINRRIKMAAFRELKTLEDFEFSFNPTIKRKQIFNLATCKFIRETRDVLLLGPPGTSCCTGRSSIWRGTFCTTTPSPGTTKLLAKYLKPDLLIVDDMGMKQLPKRSGEYLFEIIMRRYETRSTIMTSNRPLEDWGKLIGDVPSATAILDRFLHHAEMITITGKSYRLRNKVTNDQSGKATPAKQKA